MMDVTIAGRRLKTLSPFQLCIVLNVRTRRVLVLSYVLLCILYSVTFISVVTRTHNDLLTDE